MYCMKLTRMMIPCNRFHHNMAHSWILSESWFLSHMSLYMSSKVQGPMCSPLKINSILTYLCIALFTTIFCITLHSHTIIKFIKNGENINAIAYNHFKSNFYFACHAWHLNKKVLIDLKFTWAAICIARS